MIATYLKAIVMASKQACTIFGCLLSKPFISSSWANSFLSISTYIRQISIPTSRKRGLVLKHLEMTPDITSEQVLK